MNKIIEGFQQWFADNKLLLDKIGVTVDLSKVSEGSSKNNIYVHLQTARHLATITLWETGESDFDMVAVAMEDGRPHFEVNHYDFVDVNELYTSLESFVKIL